MYLDFVCSGFQKNKSFPQYKSFLDKEKMMSLYFPSKLYVIYSQNLVWEFELFRCQWNCLRNQGIIQCFLDLSTVPINSYYKENIFTDTLLLKMFKYYSSSCTIIKQNNQNCKINAIRINFNTLNNVFWWNKVTDYFFEFFISMIHICLNSSKIFLFKRFQYLHFSS